MTSVQVGLYGCRDEWSGKGETTTFIFSASQEFSLSNTAGLQTFSGPKAEFLVRAIQLQWQSSDRIGMNPTMTDATEAQSTSTSTESSETSPPSTVSMPPSTETTAPKLPNGAKIGIAVSASIAGLLTLVILIIIIRRYRRRRAHDAEHSNSLMREQPYVASGTGHDPNIHQQPAVVQVLMHNDSSKATTQVTTTTMAQGNIGHGQQRPSELAAGHIGQRSELGHSTEHEHPRAELDHGSNNASMLPSELESAARTNPQPQYGELT
ncbi:hypothetical protein MKZ38_001566 [Zalerion maritima]|uniref:Uncharacterized protein n=1 Tax=Zalerion maritima TaxID=339359 RepID=A0AAD5RFB8_9PEZI|nr:hypothetical protein MKZ38_001566 [Zalerion maritima]